MSPVNRIDELEDSLEYLGSQFNELDKDCSRGFANFEIGPLIDKGITPDQIKETSLKYGFQLSLNNTMVRNGPPFENIGTKDLLFKKVETPERLKDLYRIFVTANGAPFDEILD